MAETVRVEEAAGAVPFAASRRSWSELAVRAGTGVFRRWEWLFPWWSRFGQGAEPLLLLARDGSGTLRGLLPLRVERAAGGLTRWALLGDRLVGSDGLGAVIDPAFRAGVEEAFSERLAGSLGRWDLLELRDLDRGDPLAATLEARLLAGGASIFHGPGCRCPTAALGMEFGEFLAGKPRRENLTRRRSWLERQPGFRIDCVSDPERIGEALDRFLGLHALRWGARWSDAIPGPAVEGFHREAVPLLAEEGRCRIYLAWLQGRPVAGVYALVDGSRFYYYLPVFDPAWSHRSVGLVLLGHVLERAASEGFARFEFLRGEESYKLDWADGGWDTFALHAAAPRLGARAFEWGRTGLGAVRSVAGRALPEGVVWRWRRLVAGHTLGSVGGG